MILADGGLSLCGGFGYHRSAAADTCLFPSLQMFIACLFGENYRVNMGFFLKSYCL